MIPDYKGVHKCGEVLMFTSTVKEPLSESNACWHDGEPYDEDVRKTKKCSWCRVGVGMDALEWAICNNSDREKAAKAQADWAELAEKRSRKKKGGRR